MHIISRKALNEFIDTHRIDRTPFDAWYKFVTKSDFANFASLRKTFNSVDAVGKYFVFDIGGNKYRIVAAIHFNTQKLFIRHVFTHAEYDKWKP